MPLPQPCPVHRVIAKGIGYVCPSCGEHYCTDCVEFYIAREKACVCGFPASIPDHFTMTITDRVEDEKKMVTVLDPEIVEEMRKMGIGDDIFDEIVYMIKEIPPEQRIEWLYQKFEVPEDIDDIKSP